MVQQTRSHITSFNNNTNRGRQTDTASHVTIVLNSNRGREAKFLGTRQTDGQVTTVLTVKDADRQVSWNNRDSFNSNGGRQAKFLGTKEAVLTITGRQANFLEQQKQPQFYFKG